MTIPGRPSELDDQNGATPPEITWSDPVSDARAAVDHPDPGDPDATWRDLIAATLLIWAAQLVLSMPLAFLLGRDAGKGLHPLEPWALLAFGLVSSLVTIVILWQFTCRKYGRSFREGFVLEPVTARTALYAAGIGMVCAIIFGLLSTLVTIGDSYMAELIESPTGLVALCLLAVLLPPVEELQFRGFVFPIMRKYTGPAIAVAFTAIWFAAAHVMQLAGDWMTIPFILGVAIVLTVERQITGSLTPCIITHWVYNATLVAASLTDVLG